MADQGFQERTEKATSRRREKARDEGQVAKSMELNAAAMVVTGFVTLFAMGPVLAEKTSKMMSHMFSNAPTIASSDPTFMKIIADSMMDFFSIVGPLFGIMVVVALLVNIVQVGFKITPKSLEPKFEKLDVIKGLKKFVSAKMLVDLIKNVLKLVIIGSVAFFSISGEFTSFFDLPDMTIVQIAIAMGKLAMWLAIKIGGVILAIAILDYMFQRYEFEKNIRMSKQDIRDEHKETEGNPLIKSRARQIQREMARSRMMQAVPEADVVITNPTHLAVALKYDQEEATAPIVIAKGERLIAQRIKEVAREHNIPMVEDKPLARALFKLCDIGQMVPANLYRAVAEVLAYVYRVKNKAVRS